MVQSQDVIIVGGGLSGSLMAWTLRRRRPELSIQLLDSRLETAMSKTWSFHQTDLGPLILMIDPLITRRWRGHSVEINSVSRSFQTAYCSIRPSHLHQAIKDSLGPNYIRGKSVAELAPQFVKLESGEVLSAPLVIDARGTVTSFPAGQGYQKFVGLHCVLKEKHGLTEPILMDANVAQEDGYRFIYILPWSEHELLIEDTRYSDSPVLDIDSMIQEIKNYAQRRKWEIDEIKEQEVGVLPIPFGSSDSSHHGIPVIGVAGGFFHPVTGYSLADAMRIADRISRLDILKTSSVMLELARYRKERESDQKFFYLLNRMLFKAAEPDRRIQVFEHFYRMPETLIQNFYAGRMSWLERVRVLSGKPPVSVRRALKSTLGVFQ